MAVIDLSGVNEYPFIRRVQVGTTAQQFTLPDDCSVVDIAGDVALYFSTQEGADGDTFGPSATITNFSFVPAGNTFPLTQERGQQSTRNLCVGTQSGTGYVSLILTKRS